MGLFDTLSQVPIIGDIFNAGAQGTSQTQGSSSSVNVGPDTALQQQLTGQISQNYSDLGSLLQAGPGQQDVSNSYQAQQGLAGLLQNYSQGGYVPNQQQVGQANQLASSVYAPQQAALNNVFAQQQLKSNQMAAQMGRNGNDPVLRNMLAQSQAQQQSVLSGQQTAYAAQYANQMPQMNLQFANQYAQVQGGLASQALNNKLQLLSLGSQLQQNDRNYQLAQAGRATTGTQSTAGNPLSGLGAIFGVAGGGAQAYNQVAAMGGGASAGAGGTAMAGGAADSGAMSAAALA